MPLLNVKPEVESLRGKLDQEESYLSKRGFQAVNSINPHLQNAYFPVIFENIKQPISNQLPIWRKF